MSELSLIEYRTGSAPVGVCSETTNAMMIETSELTPEMMPRVLPANAPKIPMAKAPYNPATGPNPATSPKLWAADTMRALAANPPVMSPRRVAHP